MTAPAPAPPAAPAQRRSEPAPRPPAMFERYTVGPALVPREIVAAAQKQFSCRGEIMRRDVVGFSLSEESAIWQMPCDTFAYQSSSVFALVYAAAPGKDFRFLVFPPPRGKKRSTDASILIDPEWDVRTRTVTSISLGRADGACGTLERHRVTETGDFALVEYREKAKCDGPVTKPQNWPVVFKAP